MAYDKQTKEEFQSTPPYGERLEGNGDPEWLELFQSTPPYGERPPVSVEPWPLVYVSIHAPVRGATLA